MRCRTIEKTAVLYVCEGELCRGDETVRLWCETKDFVEKMNSTRSQRVALDDLTQVITTTVLMLRNQGYDVRVRALVTKD